MAVLKMNECPKMLIRKEYTRYYVRRKKNVQIFNIQLKRYAVLWGQVASPKRVKTR